MNFVVHFLRFTNMSFHSYGYCWTRIRGAIYTQGINGNSWGLYFFTTGDFWFLLLFIHKLPVFHQLGGVSPTRWCFTNQVVFHQPGGVSPTRSGGALKDIFGFWNFYQAEKCAWFFFAWRQQKTPPFINFVP